MGEYINNHTYIKDNDNWYNATKQFSNDSLNSLFDVDEDGEFTAVEKDRMESLGVLNTLQSIHPAVAKVYNDVNFQIKQGSYLTKKQINNGYRFMTELQKILLEEEKSDYVEHQIPQPERLNIEKSDLDTDDLKQDIEDRQFLTEQQINNQI